jgi:hypothetical protein
MRRPLLLPLGLLLAALLPARGTHAAEMVPPWPYKAKEFAIIKAGGVFHIFYMRRDGTKPADGGFVDLGHATSPDLVHWTQKPPVIPVRPGYWDNREIWAPHVIERDGTYYLFYTGVTNAPPGEDLHQRIGLATSRDLYNWTRLDQPVFGCADAPWTYCDPTTPTGGEFRDPFVMPEPLMVDSYLLYYVARDDDDRAQFLIGAGRSDDLTHWTSIGSFPNLDDAKSGSLIIESPTVLAHGGRWYLFYTSWNADPIQFQVGTDPLGAPATWGQATSIRTETGWSITTSWFGPETFSDGGKDYLAAVESNASTILIWQILWGAGGHFTFGNAVVVGADVPAPHAAWDLACAPTTPGWDRLEITLAGPAAARARVVVRDVAGRERRLLLDGVAGPVTRLAWDGRDDRGVEVGSGVYFVTLDARGTRLTRRIVRVR